MIPPIQLSPSLIAGLAIAGLILGLTYALMAIGLTLVYGIMKLSNFAHGEFCMIGAYATYYAFKLLGLPTIACVPFGVAAGFAIGFIVERLLIRDIYVKKLERPAEYGMLGTLAVSILLVNVAKEVFGPFMKSTPPLMQGRVNLYVITIGWDRLIALVIAVLALLALHIFITRTKTGRSWRAVAQNRIGALITGVNIEKVCSLAYSSAGALAALSGSLLAPVYGLFPNMGFTPLIISFVIIVLGGLGSVEGSLVSAIIIGFTHAFTSALLGSHYANVIMYLVLIITLIIRPTGLFGGE